MPARQEIELTLELRCQCQSEANTTKGDKALDSLIMTHGVEAIEEVAYDYLPLNEFWEFAQLAGVLERHRRRSL